MKYTNADMILPEELLSAVQKYVQDGLIYIPKTKETRAKWGEKTGSRSEIKERNQRITEKFRSSDISLENLASEFHLSVETVKKIVYKK